MSVKLLIPVLEIIKVHGPYSIPPKTNVVPDMLHDDKQYETSDFLILGVRLSLEDIVTNP